MQENFDKKFEEILHSIDGIKKASPPNFFFTRLEARMQKGKSIWEKVTSFVVRPAITFACICLVLMVNAVVILSSSKSEKMVAQQNSELTTVDEYSEVTTALYDFENIKP